MQGKCQQEVEGWEEIKGGGLGGSAGTSLLRKHIRGWGVGKLIQHADKDTQGYLRPLSGGCL